MRIAIGLAGLLLLCAPAAALAQPQSNPSLSATVNGVRDASHARAIGLRRIDVEVRVRGAVAEAVVTAAFDSQSDETLAGEFRLALPDGAMVTGYSLDVDGALVDGVLVDQPRARAVFEDRVSEGIDPGLAEIAPGNLFKTNIFPITQQNGRTIRVRFVTPLFAHASSDEIFALPLGFDTPREGWSITVRASGDLAAPLLNWPGRRPGPMVREGDDWVAHGEGKGALGGVLTVARQPVAAVASVDRFGERTLQLSGETGAGSAGHADRVRVYWDRSRARLHARHEDELALLRRTLVALGASRIEAVRFSSGGAERRSFTDPGAAIAWLGATRYRGATSYAALGDESAPADRCLLFAGIRPTIDRAASFAARCRLDAVTTTREADMAWLSQLARRHGGSAFALGGDASKVEKALAGAEPGVTGVFDSAGAPLPFVALESRAGRWSVVAHAPERGPVRVAVAGRNETLEQPEASGRFDGDAQLLAADRMAALDPAADREVFVALSRRYGIASASLAFVVLELPEDYIRADVAPPENYPAERLAEWREQREAADGERAEKEQTRLDEVVDSWTEQVAWWEKRFDANARPERDKAPGAPEPPPPAPAPVSGPPVAAARVEGVRAEEVMGNSQPLAVQSVPTDGVRSQDIGALPDRNTAEAIQRVPGAAAGYGDGDDGNIVVTGTRRDPAASGATIELDAWQPGRDYLKAFDAAPRGFDVRFAEAEKTNGDAPIFYFDAAEWLRRHGRKGEANEMLLSALDLPAANAGTYAIVATRLERYGDLDRAIELRERAVALEPDRPQPLRFLALALEHRAALHPERARDDLERAVALLAKVALTPWEGDWDGIELIALDEANAMIPRLLALGGKTDLDPRLIRLLDVDLRVVVDWNTDNTDLDLWVDEPNGERAIYSNPKTAIGGRLSNDMTAGYGPEEYLLRRAPAGTYTVQIDVYRPDALDPNGPSIVAARLIRDFGRPTQREETVDIELKYVDPDADTDDGDDDDDARLVGRIVVPKRGQ